MFEQGFFEIGDIIVIGIVFVLLFIYNRIEKNSKTLEKVRKYAEKSKAELDKVINNKKSEIRDLTIDLEVEEKRNREILDRFSQARDQLLAESQHLNQLRDLVGKNSSQMENLQKMALHVDENLQRLKTESEYIDGVGRRLTDVQKQENSLIKGLNGINAAFQKSNQTSLEQLQNHFTNQMKSELSTMQKEMQSLRNDLNIRMENAADRGRILEEEIFTSLKEDIDSRARGLEENWMGGITDLKEKVASQVEEIQNHISISQESINQWQEENIRKMESLSGKVIDIEREAGDDAARFRLEIMQQAEEKQKEYEEILSRNFTHIETMLLDFEKMEATLKSSLTDTADNLKEEFQQYKASMEQEMTTIQKDAGDIARDIQEQFQDVEQVKADFINAIENSRSEMEQDLREKMTRVQDQLENQWKEFDEAAVEARQQERDRAEKDLERINEIMREMDQTFESLQQDTRDTVEEKLRLFEQDSEKTIQNWKATIDDRLNQMSDEHVHSRNALEEQYVSELESFKHKFEEISSLQEEVKSSIKQNLLEFEQDNSRQILQWKEQLNSQLEEISESHIHSQKELEERYNSELDGFNSQILILTSKQEESRRELEEKYLKELEERLSLKSQDWNTNLEQIEAQTSNLEASLENWKSRMNRQMEELAEVQKEEREELEKRYFSEIEEHLRQKGAGIDSKLNIMESRTEELKTTFTDWENSVSTKLENFSRDWTEQREELDRNQTRKLQEEIASIENMLNEKMDGLTRKTQDIELDIKEKINSSTREINSQKELMSGQLSDFRSQTENSIQQIEQEIQSIQQRMEDSRDEYKQLWSGFQEEADQHSRKIMGDLEKDLKDYKGAVSQRYRRLDGFIGEMDKLEGSLRRNIADITQRVQREFESFDSQMKELRDSERSSAENELKGVHTEIQQLQGALDEVKENAVSNLTHALAGFEEQFKGNLAEKDLVMRDKISDLEQDLHNNIREVSGQQIQRQEEMELQLEENLKKRLDNIKSEVSEDFSSFQLKTDQMKSEMLDSLGKNEKQYLELKQELTSSIDNLKIEAGSVIEELQGSMEQAQDLRDRFSGELNGFQQQLEARINDLEENLGSVQNEAEKHLKERFDVFEESITTSLSLRNNDINSRIDEWQNGFSHHLEETVLLKNRELEKFDNDLHDDFTQQLENLENRINDQFGVIQNLARQYKEGVLSEVEDSGKEFESYKHKMEQEMGRLKEFTDSTVDQIKGRLTETSSIKDMFQEQMDGFREQASSDIENLDGEIKNRITSITNQLDNTTEAMEAVLMKNIENRQKSYEGIIMGRFEKLEGFISDFEELENSLRKSMDDEVIRVQNEFDHFSDKMVKMRAEERKQLEHESEALRRSLSDLENRLNELKSQAHENMSEKLKVFEDDFFRDLKNRDALLQVKLDEWQDSIENDCTRISDESLQKRKQLEEQYQRELDSKLTGIQDHLYQEINRLNDEVKGFRGELVNQFQNESEGQKNEMIAMINDARQDVELWQNQVLKQLKDERASISENISDFKHSLVDNVKLMEEDFQQQSSSIQEQNRSLQQQVEQDLVEVQSRINSMEDLLEEKTDTAVTRFQNSFQSFLADFQDRLQQAQGDSDQKLGVLKENLSQTQNDVDEMRNQLSNSIQEEYSVLRGSISELEQAQQNYISQTGIFERTDALQQDLDNSLALLEQKITEVGQHRSELSGMENELERVMTLYKEGSDQMARFLKEKQKIDLMEEKIGRIMQISDTVDQKLVSFTDINDTFQEYSIKMKQLDDLHKDMEERYTRLTKKTPVLETTVNGLDKAYETLTQLEQQINNVSQAVMPLKGEIEQMENRNNNLFLESDKVDLIVKRVGSLDNILNGIEERIGNMEKARDWMARLEKRMEEISKDARDKVRLLGTLTDKSGKSSAKSKGAPDSSTRDMVIKLSREGWTPNDIARSTNLGVGEVELILEMTSRSTG